MRTVGKYAATMIVFLHGVPETAELWDGVRAELNRESVALRMPGFGCPRPSGFGATKDDYVAWIVAELEKFDEPVDLVGHDWGALWLYRIVTKYPATVRSWTADVASGSHARAKWHHFAKIWQTPGEGEAYFASMKKVPLDTLADGFESYGVDRAGAMWLAGSTRDDDMGSCILDLYRSSSPNNFADWGADFGPTKAPGLVLIATEDEFCDDRKSREVATQFGAQVRTLEGLGHWWALQDPKGSARMIREFVDNVT